MMHWGRIGDPIPCYLRGLAPDPSTNHWKPDIETLKVHYGEKSSLIKPHQGSIPGPLGLWVGAVGSRHSSTCDYHFIVVVEKNQVLWVGAVGSCHSSIRGYHLSFQHPWLSLHCFSLYTLTIYCVLPCMSVMHDAFGED